MGVGWNHTFSRDFGDYLSYPISQSGFVIGTTYVHSIADRCSFWFWISGPDTDIETGN